MPAPSHARPIAADSPFATPDGLPSAARHHHRTPLLMLLRPPLLSRRARSVGAALALTLVAGLVTAAAPARAENPIVPAAAPTAPLLLAPPSPDLPGLPTTSAELAQVPVASPAFSRAADRYGQAHGAHADAQAGRTEVDHRVSGLHARVAELDATRVSAEARVLGLRTRLAVVETSVQQLAVESFVAGGGGERLNEALASETPAISEVDRRDVLGALSMDVLLTERAAYRARIDEATGRAAAAVDDLVAARQTLAELDPSRQAAVDREVGAAGEVARDRVAYEESRVLATVEGVEFPLVALDAYYRAAGLLSDRNPGCGVRWWALAGISRVEGRHGTYGGTTLQTNGDTSQRIIGIQLNGTNETAVIGDSDGGALDGDAAFDRAVGPMQFIPQTWSRFQADGNEDGTSSPFNLYDATLAAAQYLCTASGGLDGEAGLRSAYFSYNHSLPYVDSVLGYARLYERTILLPEPAV